jgi:hypothetical protein
VGISVPSPYHFWLIRSAAKSRFTTSGARQRPLPDQPHRTLLKVLIELPACLCHRPSLKGDASTLRGETHLLA